MSGCLGLISNVYIPIYISDILEDGEGGRTYALLSPHEGSHEVLSRAAVLRRHESLHVARPGVRISHDEAR
jgi:hypothetical protein